MRRHAGSVGDSEWSAWGSGVFTVQSRSSLRVFRTGQRGGVLQS
jgi:hypothetical protein